MCRRNDASLALVDKSISAILVKVVVKQKSWGVLRITLMVKKILWWLSSKNPSMHLISMSWRRNQQGDVVISHSLKNKRIFHWRVLKNS